MNKNILLVLCFLFLGCDVFNPSDDNDDFALSCVADTEGNLVIQNLSGEELVLYSEGTSIKCIPNVQEDFLIAISNPSGIAKDLSLYRDSDVNNDYNNPNESLVFKRWAPILAENNEFEYRKTWQVNAESGSPETGELIINYFTQSLYNVDVHVGGQTGSKISSLSPGQSKTIGLDYDIYQLYYHYWESDPNSSDGIEYLGWSEDIDNFILNSSNPVAYEYAPTYDSEIIEETGTIDITNNTEDIIQIFADGAPIEEIMIFNESTESMSYINPNQTQSYLLDAGIYVLSAREWNNSGIIINELNQEVIAGSENTWVVEED